MRLLTDTIDKLQIGWNHRPLDESDAYRLCRRFNIAVEERSLTCDGFYYRAAGCDFIVVNSRLRHLAKLAVLFHEIAHVLLHAPASGAAAGFHHVGRRTRAEREADAFALCALMPQTLIKSTTRDELLAQGFTDRMITDRCELFARYGI